MGPYSPRVSSPLADATASFVVDASALKKRGRADEAADTATKKAKTAKPEVADDLVDPPGWRLFEKHRDNAELYSRFKKEVSEGEDGYEWLESELDNDALWEEGDWCYDIEELNDEFSTRRVREERT